jgi:hypothetical protein
MANVIVQKLESRSHFGVEKQPEILSIHSSNSILAKLFMLVAILSQN